MKFKGWQHIFSVALFGILLLSIVSCGQSKQSETVQKETVKKETAQSAETNKVVIEDMEQEEVISLTFDAIGGKDVMPISGYFGPFTGTYSVDGDNMPDYMTDEFYQMYKESGMNMSHRTPMLYDETPELVLKSLEMAEKHGLGVFVCDSWFCWPTRGAEISVRDSAARLAKYRDYGSFCGVFIVDEPGTPYYYPTTNQKRDISTYVEIYSVINELGIIGSGNCNLVREEDKHDEYDQYIREYCDTLNPQYLSSDYYVWDLDKNKKDYFYNLSVIRHYAEEHDIPFWWYVQCGGHWNDAGVKMNVTRDQYHVPEGKFTWNVNTALAYGTKGIKYFLAIQPIHFSYDANIDYDFQRNGLFGAWGNKTQWWYYAKKVNAQVAAIDHVLMNSVNKGLIATGEEAIKDTQGKEFEFMLEGDSWRELESVEGNTLIGCFNYRGKTALYVVNYEEEYAQKVTLNLKDSYNMTITYNAKSSKVNADKLTFDFKAGEAALIVFE